MSPLKPARSRQMTLTEAAYQELRKAILTGAYEPGAQLPTEADLGEMLGVSRTVIREALHTLEEDGLINRRHGVGTFVRTRLLQKNLNFNFGVTEMIKTAGLTPGTNFLETSYCDASEVGEKVRQQLQVATDARLLVVERVRQADGQPVVYTIDIVPQVLFQARSFDTERLWKESLFQILHDEFNVAIEYGVAHILPVFPPQRVAQRLALPRETLTLYINQTDYGSDDTPLLCEQEYHLPDFFNFVIWRKGSSYLQRNAAS